jgi:hypothetical protein
MLVLILKTGLTRTWSIIDIIIVNLALEFSFRKRSNLGS